ncbi:hypothetical protein GPA10_14485 [Streptomyces sp. p1417]|uniref:Integral membrane protein n=1 Tax=Streptomyces typhae TaxID=2681492 RepID=A0A6L6WUR7_9ACTN|nr:hypothetical protein [Streptomyces typhae]
MHGHGYGPHVSPAPSGPYVTLRVMFVVLAVVTCGFLAWAAMLRLALVTRKALDWLLFTAVVVLEAAAVILIAVDPGDDEFTGSGNTGMAILLSTLVPVIAYYLTMDIRHFSQLTRAAQAAAFAQTQAPSPYQQTQFGQTQFGGGYVPPQPQPPQPQQAPQASYGYPAPGPGPAGPPSPPGPARIDQVRAELDELSDYLRKQEGGN